MSAPKDNTLSALVLLLILVPSVLITWLGWLDNEQDWWGRLIAGPYYTTVDVFPFKPDDPKLVIEGIGWLGSSAFYFLEGLLLWNYFQNRSKPGSSGGAVTGHIIR